MILTSGTEQYLITCKNKKYIFLLTTTLTISEAKKTKADQKAAEEAKKTEAEAVLKKLLAGGMSTDEILEKLK